MGYNPMKTIDITPINHRFNGTYKPTLCLWFFANRQETFELREVVLIKHASVEVRVMATAQIRG